MTEIGKQIDNSCVGKAIYRDGAAETIKWRTCFRIQCRKEETR